MWFQWLFNDRHWISIILKVFIQHKKTNTFLLFFYFKLVIVLLSYNFFFQFDTFMVHCIKKRCSIYSICLSFYIKYEKKNLLGIAHLISLYSINIKHLFNAFCIRLEFYNFSLGYQYLIIILMSELKKK